MKVKLNLDQIDNSNWARKEGETVFFCFPCVSSSVELNSSPKTSTKAEQNTGTNFKEKRTLFTLLIQTCTLKM